MKFLKAVLFISISVFAFNGCKSSQIEVTKNTPQAPAAETEEKLEYPQKKDTVGWVDSTGKSTPLNCGIISLRYKQKLGSMNICVSNQKNKLIPVLSSNNEFTSSAYYLKVNNKIYKLIADSTVKVGYVRNDKAMKVTYSVQGLADVAVRYDCISSIKDGVEDMLKITATVTNKSQKKNEYALKAILDTVLGETDDNHFYTKNGVPVKNEVIYRTMKNEKWFMSRNINAAMQMFFDGLDISSPEVVALANYSTLNTNLWIPNMYNYREFDSVMSYNNSAVASVWPAVKLNPNESASYVYYLAFATDGEEPNGEALIYPKKETALPVPVYTPVSEEKEYARAIEPVLPPEGYKPVPGSEARNYPAAAEAKTDAQNISGRKQAVPNIEVPKKTEKVPETDFTVEKLSNKQLTSEYVQNLLDRIIALEESDANLNRAEILQLNAELDAILDVLGI